MIFLIADGFTPNLDKVPGILLGLGTLCFIAFILFRLVDRFGK